MRDRKRKVVKELHPKLSWDSFIRRRTLDISRWFVSNKINTRGDLLKKLELVGVDPPNDVALDLLFPLEAKKQDDTVESLTFDENSSQDRVLRKRRTKKAADVSDDVRGFLDE